MAPASLSTTQKVLVVAGFLISGSINTLTKKWQFQSCGPSTDTAHDEGKPTLCPAGEKHFHKPWTQNIYMFFGEACVLALYLASKRRVRAREIVELPADQPPAARAPFVLFLLPTCCDILGTGVASVGMLYLSASVWQMMRGSLIIFASILSVVFLKKEFYAYNYIAISTCVLGLFLVGLSAVIDEGGASSNVPLGIFLTVVSQLFSASQMVVEELYVKGRNAHPAKVVGSEGIWGIILMCFILCGMYFVPGSDNGSYENVIDSVHMLSTQGQLPTLVIVFMCSIAFFNFFGVTIAGQLSAVHRTINDAMRTMIIWLVEIVVFYNISESYGTPWQPHSYLQLIGFGCIIGGNMMNNAIVRIPGLFYPEPASGAGSAPAGGAASGGARLVETTKGEEA